jgi:hypothetical protein
VAGTANQGEQTARRPQTPGGQAAGTVGLASEQAERHFVGSCVGPEEGLGPGSELEESGIGKGKGIFRFRRSSSSSGSRSRRRGKRSWMN